MRIARRYLISGRVQGVGFRAFTEAQAAVEGLHGWVRNLPDGQVEVLFEGDAESVDRAEAKLRRGPGGARVDRRRRRIGPADRPRDRIHGSLTTSRADARHSFQRIDGRTQNEDSPRP